MQLCSRSSARFITVYAERSRFDGLPRSLFCTGIVFDDSAIRLRQHTLRQFRASFNRWEHSERQEDRSPGRGGTGSCTAAHTPSLCESVSPGTKAVCAQLPYTSSSGVSSSCQASFDCKALAYSRRREAQALREGRHCSEPRSEPHGVGRNWCKPIFCQAHLG